MVRRLFCTSSVVAIVLLAGCRPQPVTLVPVEGVVLLNGAPVPNVRIQFVPQVPNSGEYVATGMTDTEGRFTLTCRGQNGARAAENVVVLSEDVPEELTGSSDEARFGLEKYLKNLKNRPIPPKYLNAAQSPLRVVISASQKDYKIELSR
jgi:hypothetical protein